MFYTRSLIAYEGKQWRRYLRKELSEESCAFLFVEAIFLMEAITWCKTCRQVIDEIDQSIF